MACHWCGGGKLDRHTAGEVAGGCLLLALLVCLAWLLLAA